MNETEIIADAGTVVVLYKFAYTTQGGREHSERLRMGVHVRQRSGRPNGRAHRDVALSPHRHRGLNATNTEHVDRLDPDQPPTWVDSLWVRRLERLPLVVVSAGVRRSRA